MSSKWGAAARKAVAVNRSIIQTNEQEQSETPDLEISLNLDGNVLRFVDSEWVLDNSPELQWKERIEKLQEQNEQLELQTQTFQEKCQRLSEEMNLVKFKNQLLIEMLAIATLDEEKHREEVVREKKRSEALKKELRHLLTQAINSGLNLNPIHTDNNNESSPTKIETSFQFKNSLLNQDEKNKIKAEISTPIHETNQI